MNKSWSVVYRNKETNHTVSAAVVAETLEKATQQAIENADENIWCVESVEPSVFVFPTKEELAILDAFAKTQKPGGSRMCPRCGMHTMDEDPVRNALSRATKIQICDACGMDEAMRAYNQNEMPIREWAVIVEQSR